VVGVATGRAKALPRWSLWPLVSSLLAFLPLVNIAAVTVGLEAGVSGTGVVWGVLAWVSALLVGAGWGILGYALCFGKAQRIMNGSGRLEQLRAK